MTEQPYFPDEPSPGKLLTNETPAVVWSAESTQLATQRDGGAGWFQAIAAFSVINLVVLIAGWGINFLIGLGITQLSEGISIAIAKDLDPQMAMACRVVSGAFTLGVAGLFYLFGVFAKRGSMAAFIIGMILYAADGLIFVLFQDWMSVGFHVFVLFMLFNGAKAQSQLNQLQHKQLMGTRMDAV